MSRSSTIAAVAILGAIGLEPSGSLAQSRSEEERTVTEERGSRWESRLDQLRHNIWWNQVEIVERLKLTPEQRAGMDNELERYLVGRTKAQEQQREAFRVFAGLLEVGSLVEAEAAVEDLEEATGELTAGQAKMMVEVVRLLDEGQRGILRQDFPWAFRRPWLRGGAARRSPPRSVGAAEPAPDDRL